MSSRRVNVIEFDDENDFRPIYSDVYTTIGVGPISNMIPFPPRASRIVPRVVTPERKRAQFVSVFSEQDNFKQCFVNVIGIFDSEIAACFGTIKWLFENKKEIMTENYDWSSNSTEEAIERLSGLVSEWNELIWLLLQNCQRFDCENKGWFIKLQRFN